MTQRRILQLAMRLTDAANRYLADELTRGGAQGILPSHGDLIRHLSAESALSVSELARRTNRTKSTVSVLIDKLERAGYVEKLYVGDGPRTCAISLTPKCRSLLPLFDEAGERMYRRLTHGLTGEDCARLEAHLERSLNNFL